MRIPTTEEEVEEEERKWIGMKVLMVGIQPEGLGEVMLGNFGRGNVRGYLPQGPFDRNERYNQAGEWSDPASEGRKRDDTHMYSPTAQGRHQRNIPPPAPSPLENRFFMDWSSDGSRSPNEGPLVQNVPIGETLLSHRTGDVYKVKPGQTTPESSQPAAIPTITHEANPNATGQAILIEPTPQSGNFQTIYREAKHA